MLRWMGSMLAIDVVETSGENLDVPVICLAAVLYTFDSLELLVLLDNVGAAQTCEA